MADSDSRLEIVKLVHLGLLPAAAFTLQAVLDVVIFAHDNIAIGYVPGHRGTTAARCEDMRFGKLYRSHHWHTAATGGTAVAVANAAAATIATAVKGGCRN
uniref:Putative secreted peptide n=1 Tax=Anopheles braziliensis TaxID=58242 RepID=A0A2M3ZRK0_9DIPT